MTDNLNSQFEGKIGVITGSTQGLGEAVVRLFAARGASGFVICGRNSENGSKVADLISAQGCPTHFVEADLGLMEDCQRLIGEADSRFRRIDCLVNCAAITDRGTVLDTSPELFDRIFAVNTRATFILMQGALKIMIREGIEGMVAKTYRVCLHLAVSPHFRLLRLQGGAFGAYKKCLVQHDGAIASGSTG